MSALEGIKPQLEGYIHQIEVYRGQIEAQRNQIDQLELRVKGLESQLNQNSRNSSRPPSTDWKKSKPAFPRSAGGKIGGKKGHDLDLYHRFGKGQRHIPQKQHHKILLKYQSLLQQADKEEPPPIQKPRGKPKKTKGRNLLDRLTKHQDAVLAFAFHSIVPFTNNQAERDIRPTKTKMKVSGCFRTMEGAKIYARVQSFVSTVHKLQFNPFNELYTVLSGGIPQYRLAGG